MILLTTNPGLEDITANELAALLAGANLNTGSIQKKPFNTKGKVSYLHGGDEQEILPLLFKMRSIYHIIRYIEHWEFETEDFLEPLKERAADLILPEWEQVRSFRVTCSRRGKHPFKSTDVPPIIGEKIVKRYGTPVDLKGFEKNLRIDIWQNHCFIGTQITVNDLGTRFIKDYAQKVALKAPIAYGMLNLAGFQAHPAPLLDPFCGSGTILLEAAALNSQTPLFGSDTHLAAVAGTENNLKANGAENPLCLKKGDAQELTQLFEEKSIGYIVTNPPFGIQLGKNINYYWLFRHFLEEAHKVLMDGGRIVMLSAGQRRILNRVIEDIGLFKILHVRIVEAGGLYPGIFVLQKI